MKPTPLRKTKPCKCELCNKWFPLHRRLMKKLRGKDRRLIDEFFDMEHDESVNLAMSEMHLEQTQAALKTAVETLNQIATMPRQARARGLALATVGFIETQMKN